MLPMLGATHWSIMREGASLDPVDALVRVGVLIGICAALLIVQRFVYRPAFVKNLSFSLNCLAFLLISLFVLRPVLDRMNGQIRDAIKALALFLCITIGLKLLDLLFFEQVPRWRRRPQAPLVLRDVVTKGQVAAALELSASGSIRK